MHITMVKKQLLSGDPCRKCIEAEALLRSRGAWDRIDQVIWAVEGQPESEGMRLAEQHGMEAAPFFVVDAEGGPAVAYSSVLRLMRERLRPAVAEAKGDGGRPQVPSRAQSAPEDVQAAARALDGAEPQDVLRWVLARHGRDCALAFSGAEDVALIDMAHKSGLPFSVFCLDTGRLHPETYRFIEKVRQHYDLPIELVSPEAEPLRVFVQKKGLFSFYDDGHQECCGVRKVAPLRRTLARFKSWVTGQRRDQSPTRTDVPTLQLDPAFEGREGELWKLNPLAGWSSEQTWSYIRANGVPYNELHERGFASIGCEPCTRPTLPNQHEREGRWWWEEATRKECGLHTVHPAAS
ncbi:MAG: phosphoadenylyl-sulfate reductase [Myxococcales bacterium]|nr:phosphoadenylyl-sulfate reductase [Myxococcales bacterium]